MAVLSLPLTFTNSFWSQDYRRGIQVLYDKLEQGVSENEEIVSFIRARATAEAYFAQSLMAPGPTGRAGTGFDGDDGASLLMAFRGLQAESVAQGRAHNTIAKELTTLVANPFEDWALGYKERLKQSKSNLMDGWLRSYEQARGDVTKLKEQYLVKVRKADEAEDDAKFAPTSNPPPIDNYTNSPRVRPVDRMPPQRSASVSERIAQRLKEIQKKSIDALAQATSMDDPSEETTPVESGEEENGKPLPKVDKGKGKEVEETEKQGEVKPIDSPPPLSPIPPPKDLSPSTESLQPPTIILAGLPLTPISISQLLSKAAEELPLRPVRFPLLGEYQDAFTGDEFVGWLKDNVTGLGGNLDMAEEMARDLTEREGLLRRLGELGNQFEDSAEAFYQFRPKAFEPDKMETSKPQQENLLKKTGNLYSLVSKALNTNSHSSEPAYIRARNNANEADKTYRVAVRRLDRHRLALEERIEDTFKILQKWEAERLRAVKTVLLHYHGTLSTLPKSLEPSLDKSGTLLAVFQPDQDLVALIERYRTGPFRPDPQVYEGIAHEESDVVFGIDLRRWSEGGWYASFTAMQTNGEKPNDEKKEVIPPVLTALLSGLESAYARSGNDAEKRKAWIYEVPLPAVHHLREILNAVPPGQPFQPELMEKFDAPIIAACVKLWALELNPPLTMFEGWEEFRKVYQGKKSEGDTGAGEEGEKEHLERVAGALQRLPRVHLYVLDAILKHIRNLVASTKVEESDEVYFTKLALSMGRSIIRPQFESELSVHDRHPTSLVLDLLTHYDALLPPSIERKKRESERKLPIRKRTALTDMRLSRSKISFGADATQLLAAQQIAQNPSLANKSVKSPEMPSQTLPTTATPAAQKAPEPPVIPTGLSIPPPPPASLLRQIKTPPPPPPLAGQHVPPPPPAPASVGLVPPPPPPPLANQPPARPFKEPPPELDDLPPRPSFKEPPPELDDLPPRPAFVDPGPEDSDAPSSSSLPSPPSTHVIPPTPHRGMGKPGTASPRKFSSRSPSPPANAGSEDVVLGTNKPSISRGAAQSTGAVRGSRVMRPPRPLSGNVQSMVQSLNRTNMNSSPGPTSPRRFSGSGTSSSSPVRRPSSIVGRNATSFSRRTMASDAEDDLVDKK